MKKIKTIFLIIASATTVLADEGMWMPQLIDALNFKDMKKNGFKLTAEQIYSINKTSMKDGVAIFGGGCTAEVISTKGLVLTNHHCGFSSIAALSSVQNDHLKNGYFAMQQNEELYCKGLTVTFIKRIEDVSKQVLANTEKLANEKQRDSVVRANMKEIEKNAKKDNHYEAFVRAFYYGNEYYLFVTEVFKDIRLVGAPPESIGKFGGETDNWVWPRHNADFSLFRIYANKENKPSEYNKDNIPYTPLYSFPISTKGVEENDFTMVYGFPGRTQEYLSSFAVDLLMNQQDPIRVKLRGIRLDIMDAEMKQSDSIRLMYTSKYANVANAYKKWKGEMLGLQRSDALTKKKVLEQQFLKSVEHDATKKEKYENLFKQFQKSYAEYAFLSRQLDYYTECLWGVDGLRLAGSFVNVFAELKKKQTGLDNRFATLYKETKPSLPFKNLNKDTDKKLFYAMMTVYFNDVPASNRPVYLDSLVNTYKGDLQKLSDDVYTASSFVDNDKAKLMFDDIEKNAALYEMDPLYRIAASVYNHYQKTIVPQATYLEKQLSELQKEYMQGLRETMKDKKFYPDANGTLRIAYGKVSGYEARDGVQYKFYTTIDGLVEKNKTGEEDFYVKPRLLELYLKKDFGPYADKNGKLRTAFIASNHTTGGNSGSPVLNAKGELVGTNFDRNWEGTMSDVMYNVNFCRNISLDIRFTLWMIDRYAGAGYLLKEMKIVK